jgi:plastocyanin
MGRVGLLTLGFLGLVSLAAAGNVEGKLEGWSGRSLSPRRPAVVWLDGLPTPAPGKSRPAMAQRGGRFVPSFLVVIAGQTVDMPNEDNVAHNVYSLSVTKTFDLGFYAKGQLKNVTFERPGVVDVLCLIHGFMRARILVVPNEYYSTVGADGSFRIRDAPAGKFALTIWRDATASFSQEVIVPAGTKSVNVLVPSLPIASHK